MRPKCLMWLRSCETTDGLWRFRKKWWVRELNSFLDHVQNSVLKKNTMQPTICSMNSQFFCWRHTPIEADSVTCVCNYLLLLRYDTLCEYIIIIIARDLAWLTLRFWLQKRSFWHWDCKVRWINTKIVWLMRLKFSLQSRSLDIETAKWVNVINGFDSNSHSKIPFLTLTSLLHRFQIWRFETERTHANNSMNV